VLWWLGIGIRLLVSVSFLDLGLSIDFIYSIISCPFDCLRQM
jgi:hypothetical protein